MRILVTGGAGFIGSHVADDLIQAGHQVLVVDDFSTGRRENLPEAAAFEQIDIRDGEAVIAVSKDFGPQCICHQAAQTSVAVSTREPIRDAEINVVGTLNLLQAALSVGVERFVFASTGGAVYGEVPNGQRASVGTAPRPLSPYACSKFAVEGYLEAYRFEHGLDYQILRYANVYGPRQDPHGEAGVVAIFSERLLAGQQLQINARRSEGDGGCVRDYVYVADVVRANRLALEGALGPKIVNICSAQGTSTLELAQALGVAVGVTPQLRFAGRRPGDVERSVLDAADYLRQFPATTLEQGLAETVAWFRSR
ncbi:MAG: SDR family NAD(P)-dependent oxidoreductase [Myxococcales bacterium]|nr:SDR family NAD(P)-dependent oxidoreductase [Myxococcales bacterium]